MTRGLADESIRELVKPWARRYRRDLGIVVACGLLGGVSVFFENAALESLSRAIASDVGHEMVAASSAAGPLSVVTGIARRALHGQPPTLILAVMLGGRLLRLALATISWIIGGRLRNRTRDDLESSVLGDLLKKEPAFFAARPPAEILNRLGEDVGRVAAARMVQAERYEALFLMAGNILFFVDADARMAFLAVLTCAAGVWVMHRVAPGQESDKIALAADDAVKGRFEELLDMTQEVQVSDLSAKVRRAFQAVQERRRRTLDDNVARSSLVNVVSTISFVLSLASLVVVALYFLRVPNPDARAALIPVMLRALPELFAMATQLIQQNQTAQLGETCAERLLEYEDHSPSAPVREPAEPLSSATRLVMQDATFRYPTAGGGRTGGVGDVTTSFAPGRSTAIVGGAGSGKSTVLQLLLGQLRPQSGSVTIDGAEVSSLSSADRARTMALTPQTTVLFDGSIADNLYFGSDKPDPLPAADLELLDQLGILEMCRNRSLELEAGKGAVTDDVRARVVVARSRIAERLRAAGIKLVPASRETPTAYWMLEHILGGRADRARVLPALRTREANRVLRAMASKAPAAPLVTWAKTLVESTHHWLMLESYAVSSKLAPFPIDQEIWELRRACAAGAQRSGPSQDAELLRVALTCSFAELQASCSLGLEDRARLDKKALAELGTLLHDVVVLLEEGMVHPLLSWRDNLVFASITLDNRRQGALVDRVVLEESIAAGLGPVLERGGLAGSAGRGGARLSGGQRQLVALARTLLRRTPVVILDEPTSALDPASRGRVSKVLREWKEERIVIIVSHDAELAAACDDVRLIERGHLVASGTFDEVAPRSSVFGGR